MERTFARGSGAPSNKIIALGIFVVTIIVVVVIFKTGDAETTTTSLILSEEREQIAETDSDGDGLKDWEESLYNTNPQIADTDGDGLRDKEEVDQEKARDAQEEQELLAENVAAVTKDQEKEGPLGYSTATSRLLLAQYFAYKDAGVPLKDSEIESIVSGLPEYEAPERTFTPFTENDITTIESNTSADLRAYGNALAQLINDESESSLNELLVLSAFAQNEDGDTFVGQVGGIVAQYTYVLEGMKTLPVPSVLANTHLLIMNRMGVVRNDFEVMQTLEENPFAAVSAIGAYNRDSDAMAAAFNDLRGLFADNGIEFEDSEPGSIFNE